MKCFIHNETESIGICKACQKAVCAICAIDTGRGLACSNECVREVHDQNAIIDKSKRIYSIGESSKLLPTGLLMYYLFGFVFLAWGVYQTIERGRLDLFGLVIGAGFLLIGVIGHIRNKKLNINC